MKLFTLIFSIYLLVLSCVPCADKDECISNLKKEVPTSASHQHNKKNIENGSCTPFCSCSHCPASAFFQSVIKKSAPKLFVLISRYSEYKISFSSNKIASIWQPPKLS